MNKEEILAKSRNENISKDERAKYFELKAADFSISVLLILWLVLSQLKQLDDSAKYAMGLLVNATLFSSFAYELTKNRRKIIIFCSIVFFIDTARYLFLFVKFVLC